MIVAVPKETNAFEKRVALTPDVVSALVKNGFQINVEKDAGKNSFFDDASYEKSGAKIIENKDELYHTADLILKVNAPTAVEIGQMKQSSAFISLFYAATNAELVNAASRQGITVFSLDAIPRISRAQKMDVLSSQANLAGYKAVIIGAAALGKIFPMLMTAAGTIRPAKVVIMGEGL